MSEMKDPNCNHNAVRFSDLAQVYVCDDCDRVIPSYKVVRAAISARYKSTMKESNIVPPKDIFKLRGL